MSFFDNPSLSNNRCKVFVSGASGFLGQHIVKLLQEEDDTVESIVCFDLKPYHNNLGHNTDKPMKFIGGDIKDYRLLVRALEGIDCVIHCAAKVSYELDCNDGEIFTVNVDGTEVLLDAVIESNTRYFVHVSDVAVVCGQDPIYYGAENTTMIPKKFTLDAYAKSKYESELRVAKRNGQPLKNGSRLSTVILRPTLLYGEGDPYFITEMLKIAKQSNGILQRVDNIFTRTHVTYVGNAAWACIKAKDRLRTDPRIGGEEFFITDDTPVQDPFEFAKSFMESRDFKLSPKAIPFWILMIYLNFLMLLALAVKPFYRINIAEKMNHRKIRYLNTTYFFNRTKAILRLVYEPRYTPDESLQRSAKYYKYLEF
ncbi:3 beta-hydroxysteroid dehydrogenase/Delta 5--_4-isomerase [Brevipalpus obovatus]|uniref:3 beta-hydroxysteroid dehydrogenase/Delta 5-->4-isomerase n=1 Tax=Brevipalpus obovatus TaxID=246614 RepID=UPI003D9F4E62